MDINGIFTVGGALILAILIGYLALDSMGYFHKKPANKG